MLWWYEHGKKVLLAGASVVAVLLVWWLASPGAGPHKAGAGANGASAESPPVTSDVAKSIQARIGSAAADSDWEHVGELIDEVNRRRGEDDQLAALSKELTQPLRVDCRAHFIRRSGQVSSESLPMALDQGDQYWLQLTFSAPCYLYIFEHTSSGWLNVVFPSDEYSSARNPVDTDLRLPESYSAAVIPEDTKPGTYTIYIVAAVWRQTKLEELIRRRTSANQAEILALLDSANEHTSSVAGLAFAKYEFQYRPARLD